LLEIIKQRNMNAKQVLNKIMTLLAKDEAELTYAKLADGTIVESATFDVGEDLFVVSEDGTKSPAPDGFHDLMLKDTEGNETLLKVKSEGGKIVERENVEMADADADMVEVKDLPQSDIKSKANEIPDIESPASNSKGLKPASMMAEETEEVGPLPTTGDGMPADTESEDEGPEIEIELKDMVAKLSYRIEEMEKKIMEMAEPKMKEEVVDKEAEVKEEDDVDMELPKLDGAPVETKMSIELNKKNYGKKSMSTQDSFLSKLYK
jgi:hypothetical protein